MLFILPFRMLLDMLLLFTSSSHSEYKQHEKQRSCQRPFLA